jgi:hypothetical protein
LTAGALSSQVDDLQQQSSSSQQQPSQVLHEAGLVASTRRGTWAYDRLVDESLEQLRQTLGG